VVRVKFHPKNHEVKFDRDDPQLHKDISHRNQHKRAVAAAHSPEAQAQFDSVANAVPGSAQPATPPSQSSASAELSSASAEVSSAVAGLSATTASFVETMAAIKRAKASGDSAEVDCLKAEFAHSQGE
jgi:cobalamin biosynthesis protein CobT